MLDRLPILFPAMLDRWILLEGDPSLQIIIVDGSKGKVSLDHIPPLKNITILQSESSSFSDMYNQALSIAKGDIIDNYQGERHTLIYRSKKQESQ